jgi:hypothetical protein
MRMFELARQDDRWTLLDPAGRAFFSLGVDCVSRPSLPDSRNRVMAHHGGDGGWFERFADAKLEQLKSMGFNTLGAWHEKHYWRNDFPKTIEIRMSAHARKANTTWGTGFPDVFDASFPSSVEQALVDFFYGEGRGMDGNQSLIGYFTDNELHWWGSSGYWGEDAPGDSGLDATGLVDDYIGLSPATAGKQAWIRYLTELYQSIERLNEAWNSEYIDFDDLLHLNHYRANPQRLRQDKEGFLRLIAERYFRTTSEALKRYDPHHLNLGCRFVGVSTPRVVLEVMEQYVDAVSVNFYTLNLPVDYLSKVHQITGLPIMITEFSICAGREAGFILNTNGARSVIVRNQHRRAEEYQRFVGTAHAQPYMIGTHWFALYDFGNPNGLIGNYGLLSLDDEPYRPFTDGLAAFHASLLQGSGR